MTLKSSYRLIAKIIFKHLDPKTTQAFVFGSRALKKPRQFSDIDVGIISPKRLSAETQINIEDKLENSNIPYVVEVVDFHNVDKDFKKVALQKTIDLKQFLNDQNRKTADRSSTGLSPT